MQQNQDNHSDSQPTQIQSPASTPSQTDIRLRYGTPEEFANTFSVLETQRFAKFPARCVNGSAPSLYSLERAYGKDYSTQWLATHLVGLSEYSGAKEKISNFQLVTLSNILRNEFGYLKTTEFMLFFSCLQSARWGKIEWGQFDPIVITDMLRRHFLPMRAQYIDEYEQQLREKAKIEHDKRAIPHPGFLKQVYEKFGIPELLDINNKNSSR